MLLGGQEMRQKRPQINLKVGLKKAAPLTTGCSYKYSGGHWYSNNKLVDRSGVWQLAIQRIRFLFLANVAVLPICIMYYHLPSSQLTYFVLQFVKVSFYLAKLLLHKCRWILIRKKFFAFQRCWPHPLVHLAINFILLTGI